MASKSAQEQSLTPEAIEETLDTVDKTLERVKTLYEQYFLGIQKQPPTFVHNDLERKLRDLTQAQIRNTGLRYRLATLQQKLGAYNSYWKRTLRQIENGTYLRNLSKIGREAVRTGAAIPEEILAAMPKRMREQVLRDRDQALAVARRRKVEPGGEAVSEEELLTLAPEPAGEGALEPPEADEVAAVISEPTELKRELRIRAGAHVLDESDSEFDIDAFFESVVTKDVPEAAPAPPPAARTPASAEAARTQPLRRPLSVPGQAPSQVTRPNPIAPGTAATRGPVAVEQVAAPGSTGELPGAPGSAVPREVPATVADRTMRLPAVMRPPGEVERTQPMPPPTGAIPRPPTAPLPKIPPGAIPKMPTGAIPKPPAGAIPRPPAGAIPKPPTGAIPAIPKPSTGPVPPVSASETTAIPRPVPAVPRPATSATPRPPTGGAPKPATTPVPRAPTAPGAGKPPPGMTDADVNALYTKYVQAKQSLGEQVGPEGKAKLLKTIHAQAPKIMEQYKAKAVDFSVVVKDNQVVIRAKPKT